MLGALRSTRRLHRVCAQEDNLLPQIAAAFALPWVNDLITSTGFTRAPQASCPCWSNTLQGTAAATAAAMAYEASKKWGAAPTYLAQLPKAVQAELAAPLQEQFVRRKESLLVEACEA